MLQLLGDRDGSVGLEPRQRVLGVVEYDPVLGLVGFDRRCRVGPILTLGDVVRAFVARGVVVHWSHLGVW